MSEAIRSYRPSARTGYSVPVSRGGLARWLVLLFLIAGMAWLYWTTRDTWPMERLVPRDQTFHLRAQHVLASREKAADSPLWNVGLLPEKYRDIPGWLRNNFGLPDWVLNNLVPDVCYVSGKDLSEFTDLLVVTRMSRIGCLLERYHGFVDGIEDEYAGGLFLRKMTDIDAYYAVRGRTLVFSPSRAALIEALTLGESGAVETLEGAIAVEGGDVQGRIQFAGDDPLGLYFERTEFGLNFAPTSIHFSSQILVRPAWRAQLDALASGAGKALSVPAKGCIVLAGDLNTPLPAVWSAVDGLSGGALSGSMRDWIAVGAPDHRMDALSTAYLEGLRASLGTAFALQCVSFDSNGIVPLPELELYLETRGALAGAALDQVPVLEKGNAPVDWAPCLEPETGIVRFPIGWGSIVEPALLPDAGGLRIALHPEHLRHLLAAPAPVEPTAESGHLFLRVRPADTLALVREGGAVYAGAGLVRGQTAESFDASMLQLQDGMRQVVEVRATAEYDAGAVRLDIVVELEPVDASAAPQ